jgi:phosphate transport system substrate-binding protein
VQAATALKFFEWAYKSGDKTASDLDYVPMPDSVKANILKSWADIKDTSGKAMSLTSNLCPGWLAPSSASPF